MKEDFEKHRSDILSQLGATQEKLDLLADLLFSQSQQKNFDGARETLHKLEEVSALRSEILGVEDPFNHILRKHQTETQTLPYPNEEGLSPEKRRAIKPEKYVDHARAHIGIALISKASGKGREDFLYNDLGKIGATILQPNKKNDGKSLRDARLYAYQTAIDIARPIIRYEAEYGFPDMASLLDKIVPAKINNPLWNKFYNQLIRNVYGKINPQDFVQEILLRFVKNKNIVTELKLSMKQTGIDIPERPIEKLNSGNLTPLDELTLCNKLTLGTALEQLTTIFNGANPVEIAQKHGWVCPEFPFEKCLQDNREKMANLRGNIPASDKEGLQSVRNIQNAMRMMASDQPGWDQISNDYKAFKFVHALIGEIGNNDSKIQTFINILFPIKQYSVDGKNGFLLVGTQE